VSTLYGRRISLIVGDAQGNALDLSDMHITFNVHKSTVATINRFDARIYNLAESTYGYIGLGNNGQAEFNKVVLQAGYADGPFGTIFSGEIQYYRKGRTSPTDTFLEIYAGDADKAVNFAVASGTLPAGSKQTDVAKIVSTALATIGGTTAPTTPPPDSGIAYPRGKVVFGMARDVARKLGAQTGSQWSIQDGMEQYLDRTKTLPGATAIVVNSATGMIGIPVQTIYGIEVTMLLNPDIKFGALLQINNKDIQTSQLNIGLGGEASNSLNQLGAQYLSADGFYKVVAGEYVGDTRGNPWYVKLVCVAADSSPSVASVQAGWLPGP
jgi:hypothetical protein